MRRYGVRGGGCGGRRRGAPSRRLSRHCDRRSTRLLDHGPPRGTRIAPAATYGGASCWRRTCSRAGNDVPNASATLVTDVAIVGGGLAGSAAALFAARAGISVALIDPDRTFPVDFRCEKLTRDQVRLVERLGLAPALARCWTPVEAALISRGGHIVERRATDERCLRYDDMVNAVRAALPASVAFVEGRTAAVTTSAERQTIQVADGRTIEARLVVLATGPAERIRASVGLPRRLARARHSLCIGFDVAAADGGRLSGEALTWHGERAGDGVAFATLFPLGAVTRCNLFAYLDPRSAPVRAFRDDPVAALGALLPGLAASLAGVRAAGPAEVRVTDLYDVAPEGRDGIVPIGDARRSSCPATGTGASRALLDADRLVAAHLPAWLETPGMRAAKIAPFHADPVLQELDRSAAARAERDRRMALETGWPWRARRLAVLARSRVLALRRGPAGVAEPLSAGESRAAAPPTPLPTALPSAPRPAAAAALALAATSASRGAAAAAPTAPPPAHRAASRPAARG